jgi:hypothetical protein
MSKKKDIEALSFLFEINCDKLAPRGCFVVNRIACGYCRAKFLVNNGLVDLKKVRAVHKVCGPLKFAKKSGW